MNDAQAAADNYALIQAFMERYPNFAEKDLYLSSESYGGHYLPQLAKFIVDKNTEAVQPHVNLKGYAVGNPYTDWWSGFPATMETYWGHQLVSKPAWDEYQSKCVNTKSVFKARDCIRTQIQLYLQIGDLNSYALDFPICATGEESTKLKTRNFFMDTLINAAVHLDNNGNYTEDISNDVEAQQLLQSIGAAREKQASQRRVLQSAAAAPEVDPMLYNPCTENYAKKYLNQPDVKLAIHVKENLVWEECTLKVQYSTYDIITVNNVPIYNYLIDGGYGLSILVYSGDDDSVCGTIGSQHWIFELGYSLGSHNWDVYKVADQTAGYHTNWKGTKLGFLTIHSAGHEVPAYQPEVALDMFTRYLNGEFTNE